MWVSAFVFCCYLLLFLFSGQAKYKKMARHAFNPCWGGVKQPEHEIDYVQVKPRIEAFYFSDRSYNF